jgi:hypothetical protein
LGTECSVWAYVWLAQFENKERERRGYAHPRLISTAQAGEAKRYMLRRRDKKKRPDFRGNMNALLFLILVGIGIGIVVEAYHEVISMTSLSS